MAVFGQRQFDGVSAGKELFSEKGCVECHAVDKGDQSMKTGSNLHGLFLTTPRTREVATADGKVSSVKADKDYFVKSVRKPWDEMAVSETGETKGKAYPQVMPPYSEQILSNDELESIWHYVRTLADGDQAGPDKVMLSRTKNRISANILDAKDEVIVTDRVVVYRARLKGLSNRALHVGLTNGMNFSFDPRLLSVRRVWNGGFLDLTNERKDRGGSPSTLGQAAKIQTDENPLLAPLTQSGEAVDFAFKEPDFKDTATIAANLWHKTDFLDRLAALDAEFLGYTLDHKTGMPSFKMRVGKNTFSETVDVSDTGRIQITLQGTFIEPQNFRVFTALLLDPKVEGGTLEKDLWKLPAAKVEQTLRFSGQIPHAAGNKLKVEAKENWQPQDVVETKTEPNKNNQVPQLTTKAGYTAYTVQSPKDLYGRDQSFEVMGAAVAKDGTIVLGTRTSGVWKIRDNKWTLFAEGTYEVMGICIEDDKGDQIVIGQKTELTRLKDTNGDGRADVHETVCDDFGISGNYSEYLHGPVRDSEGNYYFNLNLAHADGEGIYKAGGKYMGSTGGYRGWLCRVTPQGKFEPYASGLRSPASLGFAPDGRLWYADNQGEYVGTSRWIALEKDGYYGHPSSLVDMPGVTSEADIKIGEWAKKTPRPAIMFPHYMLANSPGHPAWDLTGGKFGPYAGQCFMGDQTLSTLFRIITEKVDGKDQGCAIIFARGLSSGVMRPCFLPDGSLLLGQTGRGWRAKGGYGESLQRIVWDGKTIPGDILKVTASPEGFDIHFTAPLAANVNPESLKSSVAINSWTYKDKSRYGSPEMGRRDGLKIDGISISEKRDVLHLKLADLGNGREWFDTIYEISLKDSGKLLEGVVTEELLQAYYTLQAVPK